MQDQIRSPFRSAVRIILDFIHPSRSPRSSKSVRAQVIITIGKSRPMLSGDMGFQSIFTGVVTAAEGTVITRRDYMFCFDVFTTITFGP